MKDLFSSIYLISRIASALLNLLAVAIFTRLSSEEIYGEYLLSFAYGFIAYGLAVQWLLSAHFGQQSRDQAERIANTVIVMLAFSVATALLVIGLIVSFSLISISAGIGCAVIVIGLAIYFAANEIGRSQLRVIPVTISAFLRATFTLLFGSVAIIVFHSATALLLGISLAHVLAALPVILDLRKHLWTEGFMQPTRHDFRQIWNYGWPLILAGGAAAIAASADRIVLERFFGAATIASYGVTLDFIKQSFIIVGESVAISYVSIAKAQHGDGHDQAAHGSLNVAFATITFLAAFGVVFFLLLAKPLFGIVLGHNYLDAVDMAPWLAFANACLILRAYYFAQVIYFARTARLELISTLVGLVASVGFSLLLVPAYDVTGAAIAYTIAQLASLLTVIAAPSTRRYMPVDWPRLRVITLAACATLASGFAVAAVLPTTAAAIINILLIAIVSGTLLVRWDMFDAGAIWKRLFSLRRKVSS